MELDPLVSPSRDQDVDIHLPRDGTQRLRVSERNDLVPMQQSNPQGSMLQHERRRERRVLRCMTSASALLPLPVRTRRSQTHLIVLSSHTSDVRCDAP